MARARRHKSAPKITSIAGLEISEIGGRGDGVGVIAGESIHVAFTAPGDVVDVTWRDGRWAATSFHQRSDWRREPPCSVCGRCGGCALQHITGETYRAFKVERVVSLADNYGFDPSLVNPMISCAPASRRRALFALRRRDGRKIFGFHERGSRAIVDIDECVVLAPEFANKLPVLRSLGDVILDAFPAAQMQATLCQNGFDINLSGDIDAGDLSYDARENIADAARNAHVARISIHREVLAAFAEPIVRFGDVDVVLPPGGFLQASQEGEAHLTKLVMAAVTGAKNCADLFCGCGTFSMPLAKEASVTGIDSDARAIDALQSAASRHMQRDAINASRRNLFNNPLVIDELNVFDALLLDPPRAGAQSQVSEIAKSTVETVVSVSCNPQTFFRDAALLRDGGYTLQSLTPVDQFVYSPHIELVGVFVRP